MILLILLDLISHFQWWYVSRCLVQWFISSNHHKSITITNAILESVPFPRARVKLGGRVSSYQVTQPLTYIFEPLTVAQIKGLLQTLFVYARCQHPQPLVTRRGHRVQFFWCLAKINTLTVLLLSFEVVWDLTFFDLWPLFGWRGQCGLQWPLNHRSGEKVTVDIFWCLTPTNTLTVLVLPFKIVQNLTPIFWPFLTFDLFSVGRMKRSPLTFSFDVWPRLTHWQCYFYHFTLLAIWPFFLSIPLNHRSGEDVTVDTFWCFTPTNTLAVLVLPFKVVQNLTQVFDLGDLKWPKVKFIFISLKDNVLSSYFMCMNDMIIMNNIEELKRFSWKWTLTPVIPRWPLGSHKV